MSLNSTGPISLGGSTAGQSLEIELGETGIQPISMGDSIVRGLLGVPSGAISLGNGYGKSLFAGTLQTTIPPPSNVYANNYAGFGYSNAISDDGLTMIIGGPFDYAYGYTPPGSPATLGAAWIFTRANTNTTTWTQQAKLLGNGGVGQMTSSQYNTAYAVQAGATVAISNDGNTVAIGAPARTLNSGGTDYSIGGVWVYTRSGTTWSQQAGPLIYTTNNAGGLSNQGLGFSLAISGDGNTIAASQPNYGIGNNNDQGGVVVFVRSGTTWSAQSGILQGSDSTLTSGASMGWSVSLSKDGNTLAFGSYVDSLHVGATWIFTRSGTTWTQQGSKLVGTGGSTTTNYPGQGTALTLNYAGTLLAVGASYDGITNTTQTTAIGAMWMFKSNAGAGTFTQLGSKIVGNSQQGEYLGQGISIANTAGTVVVSGGGYDYGGVCQVLVYH